jgi:hypothetical protein
MVEQYASTILRTAVKYLPCTTACVVLLRRKCYHDKLMTPDKSKLITRLTDIPTDFPFQPVGSPTGPGPR